MLVSLKEVGKYVDLSGLTPEEIAKRLTDSGIEVEDIKRTSNATNLVIGQVIDCENHPDSDHLHITKVDIGDEILDIVCGAPNVRKGLKVIVAKVGAKLGDIEIRQGKIRGVTSNGMLCSLNELGVDPKFLTKAQIEGIEELPENAEVGNTEVLEFLGLDDVVLDLSLLANRSDCYSLYNIARELGALFNRAVNIPTFKNESTIKENFLVGSESKNSKAFYGRIIKNVEIKESSKEVQRFLMSENIRSINNLVDLGNVVMLLTGRPVHIYDLDKLPQNELIVQDNINGTVIALDDKKYVIEEGDLVVTSNNVPVCIAGIMGLKNVEVDTNTKNIFVEVANFDGATVRKTSKKLGLSSDSSMRFTKGVNKFNSSETLELLTSLLKEEQANILFTDIYKYDELDAKPVSFEMSLEYINKRLGTEFSYKYVKNILELLNFVIEDIDENKFNITVPEYRNDITCNADISEEIIRYVGFDAIKSNLPNMETTVGGKSVMEEKTSLIENYLVNCGLNEIITYTLLNKDEINEFNYINTDEEYKIFNPLTNDHEYVRRNLLYSVMDAVKYNLSYQNKDFGLFEISDIETKKSNEKHLALVLVGKKERNNEFLARNYDFYDLKSILINIFSMLNIATTRLKFVEFKDSHEFHPGKSAKVLLDGKLVAVLGEIYPSIKEKYNIVKESVLMMEVNLTKLFNTKSSNTKFRSFSKFPTVTRDYAFIIDKAVKFDYIYKEIKMLDSLIKDVRLFDIYDGKGIEDGKASIAITVYLSSNDRTLTVEDIANLDNKIRTLIQTNKFNGILRS